MPTPPPARVRAENLVRPKLRSNAIVSCVTGLPPGAPSPAKIKMNISPQAEMLVMNVDLIHK